MKAILHTQYGPPDKLQLTELDKPVPKDNEVLIKIHASTVTTSDCNVRNFTFVPKFFLFPMKMKLGYKKPKINILGIDLSGEIEAVGKDVKRFEKGDPVFGSPGPGFGAHTECISIPEDCALSIKPVGISWEEAAAVPLAGNTALYFIRDLGKCKQGDRVLIHGASGGIGTFAVQLAKHYGAAVTGVCSTANVDLVKSLGADKVIDYTKKDFTETDEKYDIVFSVVGKTKFSECKKILKDKSIYLENWLELGDLFTMLWRSLFSKKNSVFIN